MKDIITITSKGQFTLPVEIRRLLGVPATGGTLALRVSDDRKSIVVTKQPTVQETMQKYWDKRPTVEHPMSDDELREAMREAVVTRWRDTEGDR